MKLRGTDPRGRRGNRHKDLLQQGKGRGSWTLQGLVQQGDSGGSWTLQAMLQQGEGRQRSWGKGPRVQEGHWAKMHTGLSFHSCIHTLSFTECILHPSFSTSHIHPCIPSLHTDREQPVCSSLPPSAFRENVLCVWV